MSDIPGFASVVLYIVIGLLRLSCLMLGVLQARVFRGKAFRNPDGSVDDWHVEKTHYGIAFADMLITGPIGVIGAVLAIAGSRWGIYLLALVAFFFVWANVMTTANSMKFHDPKLGFAWFIAFPFGTLLGLLYLVFTFAYFNELYAV